MSIEEFSSKYTHDGAEDRKVFNISDPEYREAVRLIQLWIGNGMLSHIFFDPMALAGVLRQAYDQGRQDERVELFGSPERAPKMRTADHIKNLAAEVAILDGKLKQNAKAVTKATDALCAILSVLRDHPLCRQDLFESRDLDALEGVGGDEAMITHLAILAANVVGDGLKAPDDQAMAIIEAAIADEVQSGD